MITVIDVGLWLSDIVDWYMSYSMRPSAAGMNTAGFALTGGLS